jgi:hypothetical protein
MNKSIKLALCALGFLSVPVYPLDIKDTAMTAAKIAGNLGLAYAGTYALIWAHELGHALTFKAYAGKPVNEINICPIKFTGSSIIFYRGYCVIDIPTLNSLHPNQRADIYINGPLSGLFACLVGLLGTTFVMKLIHSGSLLSSLKALITTSLINNTQPLGIQIAIILAVSASLNSLNPIASGSDGAHIFNEFNITDKTKQISSYAINALNFATVALMGWAAYKAYLFK